MLNPADQDPDLHWPVRRVRVEGPAADFGICDAIDHSFECNHSLRVSVGAPVGYMRSRFVVKVAETYQAVGEGVQYSGDGRQGA